MPSTPWRNSAQHLLPARAAPAAPGQYDIYPAFQLAPGDIATGYGPIARALAGARQATLDGYVGVFWDDMRAGVDAELARMGLRAAWLPAEQALLPAAAIERLVAPFLGGDDPLFGTRFTGDLASFFDAERLAALAPDPAADLSIVYGCGAALAGWDGPLIYADLPKNELQFRARAGSVANLGCAAPGDHKRMYKRFYFVDWPALNRHKASLVARVGLLVDAQRPAEPASLSGEGFRAALGQMSRSLFRVRPWFEPGPWGGQWIKRHIAGLAQDVPNYAWSFELIVPENGLLFASDGNMLEASFDWLMFHDHRAVLGAAAGRFGYDFPIRFDFLDTVGGGNLSLQCHPRPEYALREFGEPFTQDETYYILDCEPGARVFLGFQEDIDSPAFRAALERSYAEASPVEVERFVQSHPAARGDLFLIPSGTIHCSGAGSLVLEISATPYIFTFKMYDWLRLDLDGRPRPLNIARAFENLAFERRGARVRDELIARPATLAEGPGWRVVHLPTHPAQFYDVHRLEFEQAIEVATEDACHVLSLVEGSAILVETAGGARGRFSHAETFVVSAAAGSYRIRNLGGGVAKVVKAFVKP